MEATPQILIVSSELEHRRKLNDILRQEGYETICASRVSECEEGLGTQNISLVFCDREVVVRGPLSIRAAEEEGLRAVRGCEHCPQVPFGYVSRQWQEFKRHIRPGDALVFFHCETKGQWGLLEGYAIIRNGKVWRTLIGAIS